MKKSWYAVHTKPHCEKKVAALLSKKKIENYYPVNKIVVSYTANKKKYVYEPLLSCVVFVHIAENEIDTVKAINNISNFLFWLGKPAVIQHDEIVNMQSFTNEYSNVKLEKKAVNPSESVRIITDPQIGIKGRFIAVKNTLIQLWLPSLGYIIAAELEKSNYDVFNYEFEKSKLVS